MRKAGAGCCGAACLVMALCLVAPLVESRAEPRGGKAAGVADLLQGARDEIEISGTIYRDDKSAVFFANARTNPDSCYPIVMERSQEGTWSYEKLRYGKLEGRGWVSILASNETELVVGVLEHMVEGSAWELLVVRSENGGRTWGTPIPVPKPNYMAHLEAALLNEDGTGELVIQMEPVGTADHLIGRYISRTSDYGRSWSEPARSRNDLPFRELFGNGEVTITSLDELERWP